MKSLAKGTSSDSIFKLIKALIDSHQKDYSKVIMGDTTTIEDIAEKLEETDREIESPGAGYKGEIVAENRGGSYRIPEYVED